MTIVKVHERLYRDDGKRTVLRRIVKTNVIVGGKAQTIEKEIPQSKTYYMDLNEEEERMLRETRCFSFESIPYWDVDKIKKEELDAGAQRKEEIFSIV